MLKQIGFGFVVGFVLLRGLAGCGASVVAQCKLEAVRMLPEDPGLVTAYDVVDLVGRLKACHAGDAGQ